MEGERGRDLDTFGTEQLTVPRALISSNYLEEERRRGIGDLTEHLNLTLTGTSC